MTSLPLFLSPLSVFLSWTLHLSMHHPAGTRVHSQHQHQLPGLPRGPLSFSLPPILVLVSFPCTYVRTHYGRPSAISFSFEPDTSPTPRRRFSSLPPKSSPPQSFSLMVAPVLLSHPLRSHPYPLQIPLYETHFPPPTSQRCCYRITLNDKWLIDLALASRCHWQDAGATTSSSLAISSEQY